MGFLSVTFLSNLFGNAIFDWIVDFLKNLTGNQKLINKEAVYVLFCRSPLLRK